MKYSLQKIVRKYYPDIHILFWNPFIITDALRQYLGLSQNIMLSRVAAIELCNEMNIEIDISF